MATKTLVQNNITPSVESIQQLSSISLMLEYDIDNTLNTIKENGHLMKEIKIARDSRPKLEVNNNDKSNISQSPPSPALPTNARKRWKILAKVLRKDSEETVSSEDEERTASVRRFKSFDLLKQDSFEDHIALNCLGKPDNWYKYKVLIGTIEHSVNIHHIDRHLTANDLMGFNNTGNICVWPSEEALTVYVLSDLEHFRGKWILELGGGMTCLTGLMLSKYSKPFAVHLTDGNDVSVDNVRKTVCLNELSCYTKCSVLKWEDTIARSVNEFEKFDCILSADCLFFDEARSALVDTIWFYLSKDGEALVMAPQRGKTLTLFVEECIRKGFNCDVVHRYNEIIWQRHLELQGTELYDENIHYPVLMKLTKPLAPVVHD